MKQNEVSNKFKLLHHRLVFKLDYIQRLLDSKESELKTVLKNALLSGLKNKSLIVKKEEQERIYN